MVRCAYLKELPKQVEDAHTLHHEPNKRPSRQYEYDAEPERRTTTPFVAAGEEEKCTLRTQEERYADEEENVAHGEEGTVEEED
jgi:hypothetical protein